MENKICEYRNCDNQLEVIRKTKKFCCTNCRKMEQTYLKRQRIKLEKYIKIELDKVNLIKYLKSLIHANCV